MRKRFLIAASALLITLLSACTEQAISSQDARVESGASIDRTVPDDRSEPSDGSGDAQTDAAADGGCTNVRCANVGEACVNGVCTRNCRRPDSVPCPAGESCDFADGICRAATPCSLTGSFVLCGENFLCGPGSECNGEGNCVSDGRCQSVVCDGVRCYGTNCSCTRPAPRCQVATLAQLNRVEFTGPNDARMRADEGIMDLEFDDICTAYAVTTTGYDSLRQMSNDGTLTITPGAANLDMGEVAVLRNFRGTVGMSLGEVALTYICIAGCFGGGIDAQQGVARLDRASMMRPLPNVVQSMVTTGSGPFGDRTVDAGPYGLTYAQDGRLYVGNLDTNGEFYRIDLGTGVRTLLHRFASRVNASAVYDSGRLLVALENREIWLFNLNGPAMPVLWATMMGSVTSMVRDRFTGRVFAELRVMAQPQIVEISADGTRTALFQRPPRLGRIAIAPDNYLYHTATFPDVQAFNAMSPPIVRYPLPETR